MTVDLTVEELGDVLDALDLLVKDRYLSGDGRFETSFSDAEHGASEQDWRERIRRLAERLTP